MFHRDIQTRKNNGDCFQVFGYPGETIARVVYMASQMNRDVTGCFGLLTDFAYVIKIFEEDH